ncbi:MAG: DNA polymerase III subunit alpha, partial [Planctomycetota bacterium]|nr:DNA polymerase III subunit alpha [Planctomycetota bacterium]
MYVSLHNRSAYSFGTALTTPKQLAKFAKQHHMPAIALTDRNGLYAAIEFQQACSKISVKPIIGAELPLACGTTVTLLARDLDGYGNLCRLVSLQHLRDEPRVAAGIDHIDFCKHAGGLICLVGRAPDERILQERISSLTDVFAGRLYVELAIHTAGDTHTARRRAALADRLGVPVVATSESRCLKPEQTQLLRALSSIGSLTLLDQPHPDKPAGLWHLRTPDEMQRLFARRPDALENTLAIAGQCNFTFDLSKNRFPQHIAPKGTTAIEYLRQLSLAGCRRRYIDEPPQRGIGGVRPKWEQVMQRIERELGIIEQVNYADYFLVFHEIVEYCRSRGIDSLARGSAADSLVCYALGVSHACPFRFDLPFDRFINVERAKFSKLADIDLDLPWDRREEVIRWVYQRWGNDRVAMIGCSNTYHTRAAVAELGKVFGLPPHEIHRATKQMRHMRTWNLAKAIASLPEAKDIPVSEEPYRTIVRMAGKLDGLPRHWAMHPCGLVVSPEPLTDLIPVQRSAKGFLIAQYDMDAIEDLGFVKVDLLGQAGLSVLRDAVAEIERTDGMRVNLKTDVDYSDAATWDMIAGGNARGVHHIESPAMTSLLQQCNCRDIDCLTAVVAIIRPGAANQGKKEKFVRRHQGFEPPEYAHPMVEPILKQTYGLMVFEEHILQVATEFAGLNLGAADVLRRALNKQKASMIHTMKREFYASARIQWRCEKDIDTVWGLLEGF